MEALDLTTIIITSLGIITLIVSGIIWVVKSKNKDHNKQEEWERKTIDSLINDMRSKLNHNCKELTKLIKELNRIKKELRDEKVIK